MAAKLKALKSWINKDHTLIFQVQILASRDEHYPKKTHLTIDLRQQSCGLRLEAEKPGQATPNHAFVQILRKHLPTFTLKDLLRDPATGDFYLPLLAGEVKEHPWYIRVALSRPPLASLVDPEQTVQVSYGQKGTFTKKHRLDTPPPDFQAMDDLLPELLRSLRQEPNEDAEGEESADAELPTESAAPIPADQRELAARLKRKLKTTKKNLAKLHEDLPAREAVDQAKLEAHSLQRYAYLVQPEAFELKLDAAYTENGRPLSIPLDPELSVGRNIEAAFERLRKIERKWSMGREQIAQFEQYARDLERDIAHLQTEVESQGYWQAIIQKYKLPALQVSTQRSGEVNQEARPYKVYKSSTGHRILVGKGARENDELTKAARSNDYWFHAVGVTGSHVIVPVAPDIRSSLPSALLREAAILALHSSRLKEDYAGECYVTRRGSLKKQKGMAAGLWKIEASETIFFRYEKDEVQMILGRIEA